MKPHACGSLVYKWHKCRPTLEDDSGRGRPKTISCALIQTVRDVISEDRRMTINDIATRVDVSYGTVQTILTQNLEMSRVCARWIPRLLSSENMDQRVSASRSFISRYQREGDSFLSRSITTDETWLFHYDPESKKQSSQWRQLGSSPPFKAGVSKVSEK